MDRKPLVSVCMISYMHEAFIAQAIEGVLMQEVDFDVELVIADDTSPDKTEKIVKHYIEKHANGHWIRYIRHIKNIGIIPNFVFSLQNCNGKYIALCEGDDFWTDPLKLKTQVHFLNKCKRYVACAHNSLIVYESLTHQQRVFNKREGECDFYFKDFLGHRPFHTASLMFRTTYLKHMNLMHEIYSGDRFLYLLLSQFGPVKYFPKVMCVYRKNVIGISHNVNSELLRKDINMLTEFGNMSNTDKISFLRYYHGSLIYNSKRISNIRIIRHSFCHGYYTFINDKKSIKYLLIFFIIKVPKKLIYNYLIGTK